MLYEIKIQLPEETVIMTVSGSGKPEELIEFLYSQLHTMQPDKSKYSYRVVNNRNMINKELAMKQFLYSLEYN